MRAAYILQHPHAWAMQRARARSTPTRSPVASCQLRGGGVDAGVDGRDTNSSAGRAGDPAPSTQRPASNPGRTKCTARTRRAWKPKSGPRPRPRPYPRARRLAVDCGFGAGGGQRLTGNVAARCVGRSATPSYSYSCIVHRTPYAIVRRRDGRCAVSGRGGRVRALALRSVGLERPWGTFGICNLDSGVWGGGVEYERESQTRANAVRSYWPRVHSCVRRQRQARRAGPRRTYRHGCGTGAEY
ncbi:hypothetical protein OH76DRAFT_6348 [Lentinus brumalis]|uniref:Uncharacterized protein n=1 Tax=Lentinus brumalis TaxID=2498619 RepID=A0A371DWW5_9APHY|nr:hypothetical protein OH76DRAFT_6348 [Polyporus brumalis]